MDQVKIGKFIQSLRKEKGLTQRELADALSISDKTVSKWETGNGMPDPTFLLPLSEILEVSLNELFSGECLSDSAYRVKAEEHFMDLVEEKKINKRNIILAVVSAVISIIGATTIILLAGLADLEDWVRILLIVIGVVVMLGGIAVAGTLDMYSGTFECRHCKTRFVPTASAYLGIKAVHSITTRYLKCPNCGKKSFCKKRLTH